MDGTDLVRDLFGKASTTTVTLRRPIEVRRAVCHEDRCHICEGIEIYAPAGQEVAALCGAMFAMGLPDSAMQVVDQHGVALMLVQSIHRTAIDGSKPA